MKIKFVYFILLIDIINCNLTEALDEAVAAYNVRNA